MGKWLLFAFREGLGEEADLHLEGVEEGEGHHQGAEEGAGLRLVVEEEAEVEVGHHQVAVEAEAELEYHSQEAGLDLVLEEGEVVVAEQEHRMA